MFENNLILKGGGIYDDLNYSLLLGIFIGQSTASRVATKVTYNN